MAEILKAEALAGVPHGFSTKAGLSTEDVAPGGRLIRVKQVHSDNVVEAYDWAEPPEADALVTDQPGLLLTIVTADCAPVLLVDRIAGVVGAAHAGWRGALGGIIGKTVEAMTRMGADPATIAATIGPTIAQDSYEVDDGFRKRFLADAPDNERFFESGRIGHYQFDLPAYVGHRLREAGVTDVNDLREDTYSQPERFFSYRRANHIGSEATGRLFSAIAKP